MVSLARTTSGLLYQSDGSLTGWTGASQWSSVSTTRFVTAPAMPISLSANHEQSKGEPTIKVVGGLWYLMYNNRELLVSGVLKVLTSIQTSGDRGITWYDIGPVNIPSIPGGGLSGGCFLDPVSSKWFMLGSSGPSLTPGGGLNGPYTFLVYQSSGGNIQGPYTLINTLANVPGTWANGSLGAGSLIYDGTNYQVFASATDVASVPVIGLLQFASVMTATPTLPTPSTPFYDVTASGPNLTSVGMFGVEGCCVVYNSVLNLWVGLIACAGNDGNAYDFSTAFNSSSTITGFSTSTWKHCQWVCPADTKGIISGANIVIAGSNNAAMCGPNGEMVLISAGQRADAVDIAGHYTDLQPNLAIVEPASTVIRYTGASDTTGRNLLRGLAHTDITIEFGCELTGVNGSGGVLIVEYRNDNNGNTYAAQLATSTHFGLVKGLGGSFTLVAAGSGTQVFGNLGATLGMIHRIKIQVIGNVHSAWLDGELQYTYTDTSSPIASGVYLTIDAQGINCDLINLSCRTSDTITVNGMQPNTSCWLRAACGIPVAPVIANSSGVGTISYQHFPLFSLDIGGTDYTVGSDSRIWGGDVLQFSGLSNATPATPLTFNNT
jgi:hypothetical protein